MSGLEFHETVMGKRYYEATLPRQIEAMNRLATAIERQNELKEQELKLQQEKDDSK